jgi:hypothetical protein
MRYLRMLGLMLLAALTLGAFAAATASAEEPGILPVLGAKSEKVELKAAEGKTPKLATPAGTITCTKLAPTTANAEGAHINLYKDVTLDFESCVETKGESKLECRSENSKGEKDALGTILVLADFHLVDLLNKTALEPGIEVILLNASLEGAELKIKCGIGNVLVKGVVKGLIKVATLTADVKAATLEFPTSLPCDTNDTLCKSLESTFLANFAGTFENATQTVTVPITTNTEVLFDD